MVLTETLTGNFNKLTSSVVSFIKNIWEEHRTAFIVTTALIAAVKYHHAARKRELRRLREEWNSAGEDVVVLHTIPSATTCPNLSAFDMKLEVYMRMAGIKYKRDFDQPFGPKGKFPWITLNGNDYSDTQLIMDFLGKKFNKNFSSHLNNEKRAIARAMTVMNDEHLYWGLLWWRFIKDPNHTVSKLMKAPFSLNLGPQYKKVIWAQGIGRHTDEELIEMIRKDIEALSIYLGKKQYLMGDSPCEVDCSIFGVFSQFVWGTPGSPFSEMLQNDYQNLQDFCYRMKETFWPDWEEELAGSVKFSHSIGC